MGCSEAAGGGLWPRLVLMHACTTDGICRDRRIILLYCTLASLPFWPHQLASLYSIYVQLLIYELSVIISSACIKQCTCMYQAIYVHGIMALLPSPPYQSTC
jgi:hypothetical protein